MAVPANTFISGSAVGNRESLHDKIWMLDTDDFPLQSAIGSGTAEATNEEWQTDALGNASSSNSNLEGDDSSAAAVVPTVRVGNRTQILKKAWNIGNTQEAVKKAGRDSEVGYQTMLNGRRIRMDLEATLHLNQASIAESAPTTRKLGGIPTWLTSNVSRGVGGASGGFTGGNTTAATDGTQRAFTEALMKPVLKSIWDNGGKAELAIMSSTQKEAFSGFTGIATQYQDVAGKRATIVGAVDYYVSNFAKIKGVPSRFARSRDVTIIDPSMMNLLWLRKFKREELAKTGDSRKFHIVGEVTLKVNNEKAHGIVADLT